MAHMTRAPLVVGLGLVLCIALAACASYEPAEYVDNRELENGKRGLFSGEDGAFKILSR